MSPLNLGPHTAQVPEDHAGLLRLLAERPGPALIWHRAPDPTTDADGAPAGDDRAGQVSQGPPRVELSGRVLENWAVKMIGLLSEEMDLQPGDLVLIDSVPHWKAAAAALAASTLGCRVRLTGADSSADTGDALYSTSDAPQEPRLVLTDDPARWEDSEALGDAELAALSPGLLDSSFQEAVGHQLPAWVLDVSAEVRQQPDQLLTPLPEAPLPELALPNQLETPSSGCLITDTDVEITTAAAWTLHRWDDDTLPRMLSIWARSGRVILWQGPHTQPDGQLLPEFTRMCREEGICG